MLFRSIIDPATSPTRFAPGGICLQRRTTLAFPAIRWASLRSAPTYDVPTLRLLPQRFRPSSWRGTVFLQKVAFGISQKYVFSGGWRRIRDRARPTTGSDRGFARSNLVSSILGIGMKIVGGCGACGRRGARWATLRSCPRQAPVARSASSTNPQPVLRRELNPAVQSALTLFVRPVVRRASSVTT